MNVIHRELDGWEHANNISAASLNWFLEHIGPATMSRLIHQDNNPEWQRRSADSAWKAHLIDHYIEHVNPTHKYFSSVNGWFGDGWSLMTVSFKYSMGKITYHMLVTIEDDLMAMQYKLTI